jgi:hypothetical protein
MILLINPDQFQIQYLFFSEPIKNNIIYNSLFIRISYSPPNIQFLGLYIYIENQSDLLKLYEIEEQILNTYNIHNKELRYNIYSNLKYKQDNIKGYIKISGLSENKSYISIVYKFINHPSVL